MLLTQGQKVFCKGFSRPKYIVGIDAPNNLYWVADHPTDVKEVFAVSERQVFAL